MTNCGWTYAIADLPTATGSSDFTAVWVVAGIYALGALGVWLVKAR